MNFANILIINLSIVCLKVDLVQQDISNFQEIFSSNNEINVLNINAMNMIPSIQQKMHLNKIFYSIFSPDNDPKLITQTFTSMIIYAVALTS